MHGHTSASTLLQSEPTKRNITNPINHFQCMPTGCQGCLQCLCASVTLGQHGTRSHFCRQQLLCVFNVCIVQHAGFVGIKPERVCCTETQANNVNYESMRLDPAGRRGPCYMSTLVLLHAEQAGLACIQSQPGAQQLLSGQHRGVSAPQGAAGSGCESLSGQRNH